MSNVTSIRPLPRLSQDAADLAELDELIDGLDTARSIITDRLEAAAYELANPNHWACCTTGRLVFHGFTKDPWMAHFNTECTWCGSGKGAVVSAVDLDAKVQEIDRRTA